MPTLDLFHPLRHWNDEPLVIPEVTSGDAGADTEDSLSARYAFSIGEELGVHRLGSLDECQDEEMRRGYRVGMEQPSRKANVYKRKLLQVRRNAFVRSIAVSAALTEEYLRRITVTVCPVSGVELTQGRLDESDWSVDRLDNNLGYVPGNVCIVSTRVNQLKSADRFEAIAAEAKSILVAQGPAGFTMDTGNGLMVLEALRIAALMAGPSGFGKGRIGSYAPFAMAPGAWASIDAAIAGFHVGCARSRVEGRPHRRRVELIKHLGPQLWRSSNRLVESVRIALGKGIHPCDVWLDGEALERLADLAAAFTASPPELPGVSDEAGPNEVLGAVGAVRLFNRT